MSVVLGRTRLFRVNRAGNEEKISIPMEDAFHRYLEYHQFVGSKENTIRWLRITLRPFIRFLAGNYEGISRPGQVSGEHLRDYLAALRPTNQTVSLNNKIRAIKAFFSYLHREGYVVRNP
ncbi:MAG: phage integrase N-terminal SAM-like domain-containing protein, partial [Firmicutes bacterium]|nr:phage integrase N-terminal SAM-like domain-containing protein [Bacillota bacterium]